MADPTTSPAFERATPVLKSGDYPVSRTFFRDRLGFELTEEGGDPPLFGIFRRDGAVVFVNAWNGPPAPSTGGWTAYFHVDDVDALHRECMAQGLEVRRSPENTVYGMREMELHDPDGNLLCFGTDLDQL